jgi:hypothetical protein
MTAKGYRETTEEELRRFSSDERFIHFVGMAKPRRPGVNLFAIKLEHWYFPPDTEKNNDFILHIIEWQNMTWMVISIPREYMDLAKKIAAKSGLRIADGIPTIITSKRIQPFPMDSDNVFTLENVSEHAVYGSGFVAIEKLLACEDAEIRKILDDFLSRRN